MEFVDVRLAAASDISAMMNLARQCPTAAYWGAEQYGRIFDPSESGGPVRLALVIGATAQDATQPQCLLGFLVASYMPPEWELENIVVAPTARRKGLASRLLEQFLARARDTKSESVTLEVQESNQAARALYRKWKFEEVGRRTNYYASEHEDAILYRLLVH